MKKYNYILILLICTSLIGCQQSKEDKKEDTTQTKQESKVEEDKDLEESKVVDEEKEKKENEEMEETILANFEILMNNKARPYEVFSYIKSNINYLSKTSASYLVEELEKVQNEYLYEYQNILYEEGVQEKIVEAMDYGVDKKNVEKITDKSIKEKLEEAFASGYKLEVTEGYYLMVIDYEKNMEFYNYVTDEMKTYLEIMREDSAELAISDMGFRISLDDYVERIYNMEKYLEKYSDSDRAQRIAWIADGRLIFYLKGIDNTPVFINKEIIPERLRHFAKVEERYKNSKMAERVSNYLKLLEENEYKINPEIEAYADATDIYNRLVNGIGDVQLNYGDKKINIKLKEEIDENRQVLYPIVFGLENLEVQNKINFKIDSIVSDHTRYELEPEDEGKMSNWGTYKIESIKDDIMSIRFDFSDYYEGAAHGNHELISLNIDLKTGEEILLQDFIKNERYKEVLDKIMEERIKEENIPLYNEEEFEGVKENQGYYFTDDELVIFYNVYEYTPYAYGHLVFEISFDELSKKMGIE